MKPLDDTKEDTIDTIIDNLQYEGINDVYGCGGGHKFDDYSRAEAKKQIQALLIQERIDELDGLVRTHRHENYTILGVTDFNDDTQNVRDRIKQLEAALKENSFKEKA